MGSVDGDRLDQFHGRHLWGHILVEVRPYGRGKEHAEKSGIVSNRGGTGSTITMVGFLYGDLELGTSNVDDCNDGSEIVYRGHSRE